MKGMRDSWGDLYIERGGKMLDQRCHMNDRRESCSDECPLFEEPVTALGLDGTTGARLALCHRTLYFTKFTDERGDK